MKKGMHSAMVLAAMLALAGTAGAQTHAPWPADWNNWSDPALWCTVGDPGNAPDTRYQAIGAGYVRGEVDYTYRMGTFEVTAGQYTAFLNAVGATDTYGLYSMGMAYVNPSRGCNIQRWGAPGSYTYTVAADYADRPVNYVTWDDAARFANWLTNGQPTGPQTLSTTEDGSYYLNGATGNAALQAVTRKTPAQGGRYYIPSEDEWYKAAFYKGGSTGAGYWSYPTASDTAPGTDLDDSSANNANTYSAAYLFPGDPSKYWTSVAGEFQNSPGPYGTYDQGGNVREWNEAIVSSSRGIRGGDYDGGTSYTQAFFRYSYDPTSDWATLGFRVVEVPEPGSAAVLVLGVGAALRRRAKS